MWKAKVSHPRVALWKIPVTSFFFFFQINFLHLTCENVTLCLALCSCKLWVSSVSSASTLSSNPGLFTWVRPPRAQAQTGRGRGGISPQFLPSLGRLCLYAGSTMRQLRDSFCQQNSNTVYVHGAGDALHHLPSRTQGIPPSTLGSAGLCPAPGSQERAGAWSGYGLSPETTLV